MKPLSHNFFCFHSFSIVQGMGLNSKTPTQFWLGALGVNPPPTIFLFQFFRVEGDLPQHPPKKNIFLIFKFFFGGCHLPFQQIFLGALGVSLSFPPKKQFSFFYFFFNFLEGGGDFPHPLPYFFFI